MYGHVYVIFSSLHYDCEPMIVSKNNAGKWIASKSGKVIASTRFLPDRVKKVEKRNDRQAIRFDLVPPVCYFVGP
jgi:hypothetical protein